ncbi:MAG: ribonuclease III [Spirochaetales bacterium]|nr:ribonuclease III [Spirochaetales bacterium]
MASRSLEVPAFRAPTIDATRRKALSTFQKGAGLRFRKLELLDLAFCHRSFVNETSEKIESNERLEFLGDSVLGIVVADYLFRILPDRPEGDLAKIKSHVVSEDSLAEIALELGIHEVVRVGRGENQSGGRRKKALLSDCMEALIGAWYLDAGYDKAARFILRYLVPPIETVLADRHRKDYKTLLQEVVQKTYHSYPSYVLDRKTGPDHQRTFWMKVVVQGVEYGPGKGGNKKSAEQEAARMAYFALTQST